MLLIVNHIYFPPIFSYKTSANESLFLKVKFLNFQTRGSNEPNLGFWFLVPFLRVHYLVFSLWSFFHWKDLKIFLEKNGRCSWYILFDLKPFWFVNSKLLSIAIVENYHFSPLWAHYTFLQCLSLNVYSLFLLLLFPGFPFCSSSSV